MKKKFKQSMQMKPFLLILVYASAATLFLSCQPAKMNSATDPTMGDLNRPPTVMEQPEIDSSMPPVPEDMPQVVPPVKEDTPKVTAPVKEDTPQAVQPAKEDTPEVVAPITEEKPTVVPPKKDPRIRKPVETDTKNENNSDSSTAIDTAENSNVSDFIRIAHTVMVNEGKKIGTPCNFYLHRVLVRAGFKNESFGANDFDVYAKRNFSSYKAQDFKLTEDKKANAQEQLQLQRYIWSYPVRTPFILQWTRPAGRHGHVAIIERYDENTLVIYQASLNRHTANRKETTIKTLLTTAGLRSNLTVYSEFKAKR